MALVWSDDLPRLPGYSGAAAYQALPSYADALHRAAGLDGPPFDPLRVAAALGVRVQPVPTYAGNRGLLLPLPGGGYRIVVRADESPSAQRFTVAHELVELGLQVGCPSLVERSHRDQEAGKAKERYCEVGAAEILLPLDQVRRAFAARGSTLEALPALASLFGASLHATLRRLVDAAPRPCAGLIVYQARRHAEGVSSPGGQTGRPASGGPAGGAVLRVAMACGGGGLVAAAPAGAPLPQTSLLARSYRDRLPTRGVEAFALGRLQGRYRVEAICPGYGPSRHVYALLHPV